MAASNQVCQMDTITLARAVAAKELSPVEAVEAVLERLDRLDPTLHMFATVVPDQAREDAKRIEADLAAGREVGALAGLPTALPTDPRAAHENRARTSGTSSRK
jgi:aspartyl-tRNA(Asn)/glutamyl-tRNA(Gln) amidotransferase subunit A